MTGTVAPAFADLTPYLNPGSKLAINGGRDSLGNPIEIGDMSERVRVSPETQQQLEPATGGETFWGPYSQCHSGIRHRKIMRENKSK